MLLIGLGELLGFLADKGVLSLAPGVIGYLYPVRILAAGGLLLYYRREYIELIPGELKNLQGVLLALLVGAGVFVAWISLGESLTDAAARLDAGFVPSFFHDGGVRFVMTAARVFGAAVVVPVMEELFWRSFLPRYLLGGSMRDAPVGRFTPFTFIATSVLFGLEHDMILAGILAGAAYNALAMATRSVALCILAHALTNLALAGYVLATGSYWYW